MKFIKKKSAVKDPLTVLKSTNPGRKDVQQRAEMTTSCKDADYIPKVSKAGQIVTYKGQKVQIMHNGVKVLAGGYHGEWMSEIIKSLKGHHEPQEEKLFYEITKRLDQNPTILELGSFWSYYSIWILKTFKRARAIDCEPDPSNLKIGRTNADLNGVKDRITFVEAAAGQRDKEEISFTLDSDQTKQITATVRTVDSLLEEHNVEKLDILHLDVQGAELDALRGAIQSFAGKKVRFVFVSTHHYLFSGDPMTHQRCKQLLQENGAKIIAAHNVLESFSGDGLIVASFDERDQDLEIPISLNNSDDSLFRPYEEDLALLFEYMRDNQ